MSSFYKSVSKSQTKCKEPSGPVKKNKQKVLILSSRGITFRQRHLLKDVASLLPHCRKDAKLDTKSKLYQLNELAEMYNCNNVLFFEARKAKDLYLWMSKAPNGPTVKMHMQNLHTMEELNFTGNCLKGSRPILSFDASFDIEPHLRIIKELFLHIFGVPKGSRKSKPFIDHVMGFTLADNKIWIRNYQINETESSNKIEPETENKTKKMKIDRSIEPEISLVEIGPRFVLTPIVIQEGSFGGPIIYQNKRFISPNQVRSEIRLRKAGRYNSRAEQNLDRLMKKGDLGLKTEGGRKLETDELENSKLFA